ncbi:MAG: efflux RND transporter permease subunit, partial [Nitrospinota bacterium]
PIDYLPKGNRNLIFVIIKTPPGFNFRQIEGIVQELERRFLSLNRLERLFSVVRTDTPLMGAIVRKEFTGLRGMARVVQEMRRAAMGVPGTLGVFITQASLFRRRGAFFGGTNVEIDIKGDSLEQIQALASRIEGQVRGIPGVNFVNSSFELGQPELRVYIDREKATELGLSVSQIGYIVETLVEGTRAGSFRERGKEIDLTLIGAQQEFLRTQDLNRIVFHTPSGRVVHLSDIATVREEIGPTKIEHIDRSRSIKLTVNIREDIPLETAIEMISRQVIDPVRATLPLGYSIDISGQAKDLAVTWNALKWSFLLAIVIIYLLMCSLFESFINPLVVMFSVPLAASGGILAVKLVNTFEPSVKMDVITMLGFVILAGIVVNNAILIIHQTLNNMEAGMAPREALRESCRTRIRPIFMSSTTSIFGMLPLVISSGAGSELYRGLGAAVLGGLAVSTLFTLVLVPILFSLWLDLRATLPLFLRKQWEKRNGNNGGR